MRTRAATAKATAAAQRATKRRKASATAPATGVRETHSGVPATAAPPEEVADTDADTDAELVKSPRKLRPRKEVAVPTPTSTCFALSGSGSRVHISTSGYSYKHWHQEGSFYDGIPQAAEFARYSSEFNSVELNGTFYRLFTPETFQKWQRAAAALDRRPPFEYTVKASQFYTHRKRLNVDDVFRESWARFWERCELLKPHLGPVLFQFPANFCITGSRGDSNLERLKALGSVLPRGGRFAFEFRDASWFVPEVYQVLREHDWCLVLVDVHGRWHGTLQQGPTPTPGRYPLDNCSWGAYVRFHGQGGKYLGAYGAKRMEEWASHVEKWLAGGRNVYVAFNNTDDGCPPSAIADARHLAEALRTKGIFSWK